MPSALVIDTSVILKWFRQEEVLADQALLLRDGYLRGQFSLFVPSLCAYEFANVLKYKQDLTIDQLQAAIGSLFDFGFEWFSPTVGLLSRAVELSKMCETTVYDGVFAALADLLGAHLVTADRKLANNFHRLTYVHFLGQLDLDALIS